MRSQPALLLAAALSVLTGCATLRATVGGWERGPNGISLPQYRIREALARGDFDAVLGQPEDDALLRELTAGATNYYAAKYEQSAAILDSAALLADDRITASISKNALSLVTNEMARPYRPRRTERLFVAYYGMLSFSRMEAWEDAAVEARRMVSLLAQYDADRDDAERPLHAAMEYLAAAVFERAGETGEAAVSYRAARAIANVTSARAKQPKTGADGEVLVVVERGFVAHRITEMISIRLEDGERDSIHSEQGWSSVARRVTERMNGDERTRHYRYDDDDDGARILSIAFPMLRRSAPSWPGALQLTTDGAVTTIGRLAASVDDASRVDERRDRLGTVTRAVARAAAKYAITKAVEDNTGGVAGKLTELGANLLERGDVRSWHVLPQELELIRLRVKPGTRALTLEVGTGEGRRQLRISDVHVLAGTVAIVPVRLWRNTQLESDSSQVALTDCALPDCRPTAP